jgi:flagellar hook protein FlgE
VDPSGYLIDPGGNRVQGYTGTGTTQGDVQITSGDPNNSVIGFSVDATGTIHAVLQDNSTITSGQVLMQNFTDPQRLVNIGNNLYTNFAAAGGLAAPAVAGTNGLGMIEGSTLELSNVDLANEMANLITAQRAFEANSKIITTSDEALQTVVNMKH